MADNRTLFDAVLRLAREILYVRQGTATAEGSTSTLKDTTSNFSSATFIAGTIFLLNDSKFRRITQHASGLFTFTPVVTDTPDDTDPYAVADADIPLDVLLSSINSVLRSTPIVAEDDTSLTTVSNQEEYTLPTAVVVSDVYKVEIATSLTSPYSYRENRQYDIANGKLRFATPSSNTGYKIRLTYRRHHTDLTAETDKIPNGMDLDYLHWSAVQVAAKHGLKVHGNNPEKDWTGKIQEAEVRIQRLASQQPRPQHSVRLSDY